MEQQGEVTGPASLDGLLVLDKPGGITSRAAVDRAQSWFGRRTRIGHTGTLDPLATGVLVLCLGNATRLVEYVQRMSKTYHSLFHLGGRSDTDDADGTITTTLDSVPPDLASVSAALRGFVGVCEQVPPAYSAALVTGQRAYRLARQGEEVHLGPRPVQIHWIDLLRYEYPELEVEVHCGRGTYIRSIARDLGEKLGGGGYVQTLRRKRVGPFPEEQAVSLDADRDTARSRVLPPALAVAELPRLVLGQRERERLRNGQGVPLPAGVVTGAEEVAVFDEAGKLMAVGKVDTEQGLLRPAKVLG
jgi:tRNA pseudouridine55 synthase